MTLGTLATRAMERLRSPEGQKLWKYSVASLVAVAVSEACLILFNGVVGMSAWVSSSLATAVASVPNYYMNRSWAWGKTGRSHLLKEVMPFWALAFLGWGVSTFSVYLVEQYAKHQGFSHVLSTALVAVVYVAAFGVLWVAKFVIFNRLLFVHRHYRHDDQASSLEAQPVPVPVEAGSPGVLQAGRS